MSLVRQVVARWVESLRAKEGFFPICDELDMLSCYSLSKIAFDMDIPFVYSDEHGEEQQLYRLVNDCFQGVKDKLFNPIGCTVSSVLGLGKGRSQRLLGGDWYLVICNIGHVGAHRNQMAY